MAAVGRQSSQGGITDSLTEFMLRFWSLQGFGGLKGLWFRNLRISGDLQMLELIVIGRVVVSAWFWTTDEIRHNISEYLFKHFLISFSKRVNISLKVTGSRWDLQVTRYLQIKYFFTKVVLTCMVKIKFFKNFFRPSQKLPNSLKEFRLKFY